MLTLENVDKEFDMRPVLYDVNVVLRPATRYVLTAPNGSGKTTLLHLMAGLSRPTRGRVLWNNEPLSPRVRRNIGIVLQETMLYGDLTAEENLRFFATLYACSGVNELVGTWLKRLNLFEDRRLRVRQLSKGQRQRLALARAVLHQPQLLLLDEPFDGLDVSGAEWFQAYLDNALSNGMTQFVVTHRQWRAHEGEIQLTIRHGRVVRSG
ncbi:MAG: ABC transporter ATP-binding protein [Alicyclobacillus sp.]|nr:ABC transporter ATP-binding protein [Alicyclobacillus sp.]